MPSNNILNKLKDHGTSGKHDLAPSTVGNDGSSITTTTGVTTTTTRRSKRQKKYQYTKSGGESTNNISRTAPR